MASLRLKPPTPYTFQLDMYVFQQWCQLVTTQPSSSEPSALNSDRLLISILWIDVGYFSLHFKKQFLEGTTSSTWTISPAKRFTKHDFACYHHYRLIAYTTDMLRQMPLRSHSPTITHDQLKNSGDSECSRVSAIVSEFAEVGPSVRLAWSEKR